MALLRIVVIIAILGAGVIAIDRISASISRRLPDRGVDKSDPADSIADTVVA